MYLLFKQNKFTELKDPNKRPKLIKNKYSFIKFKKLLSLYKKHKLLPIKFIHVRILFKKVKRSFGYFKIRYKKKS